MGSIGSKTGISPWRWQ